jgi:membrane protein YqaA with SNARE-associated domain
MLASAFGGAAVSAVVPFVNAELLLVGLAVAAPGQGILLVLAMAAGQMLGKCALYFAGGRLASSSVAQKLIKRGVASGMSRWGLDGSSRRASTPLVAASASIGLPPFYLMSVAAPALGIRFRTFAVVGFAGRVVRFAAILAIPALLARITH